MMAAALVPDPSLWARVGWSASEAFAAFVALGAFVAAALAERRSRQRAQRTLYEQLEFERMLADLSLRLSDLTPERVGDAIDDTLARLVRALRVERACLAELADGGRLWRVTHWRTADGVPAPPLELAVDRFPATLARVRRGEVSSVRRLADLSPDAAEDRRAFEELGTRSTLTLPLPVGGEPVGVLSLANLTAERAWDDELVARVRLVAATFANALQRERADLATRRSEALSDAVLASLSGRVAVLDGAGTIVRVNDAWSQAARANGARPDYDFLMRNYLEVTRVGAEVGADHAAAALEGITSVLAGAREGFTLEYRCEGETGELWYEMTVERLRRPEGGAVVVHRDVTARKRAELDAQRHREEVAHISRVATLGELAGSIAHELNQPLTAIRSNAQAALRFLVAELPDLGEVREILADIVRDDVRASEVLDRMRGLLKRRELRVGPVELNTVIVDVARLLGSDALTRRCTIDLALAEGLPPIGGDRVQLQQVVLNLVRNSLEAMSDGGRTHRVVRVATSAPDAGTVELTVRDTGPGIAPTAIGRLFEPFYSTKPDGLGMGLAVTRTIVEAHGGRIAAENNSNGGATFRISFAAEGDGAHGGAADGFPARADRARPG